MDEDEHPWPAVLMMLYDEEGENAKALAVAAATYGREQSWDVLKAADFGAGHVVVWGDEWITYDSEWSQHPDYQVQQFWQNIVDWFQPGAHCMVPTPPK